ncbi:MAG: type II toxin-antitoxin system RelE/ParE family toxin [Rhodospirillaceae bacterium]|nr:type II toxin-antitoxin system RelE/ParE family toxin [Rhodospirillaceae bacterium]
MRIIRWLGSSLDDLSDFPADVKRAFGFALREVQKGETPPSAAPLTQFGSGVYELKESHDGDAYRSVYVVKLKSAGVVLRAGRRKSKSGKAMPREDITVIEQRLKRAKELDAEEQEK